MSSMKERVKEVKRDFIVEVAKGLFFGKGYENTSIDEVALSAGISKSTLYTYVKSKEELFMHIHLAGMKERLTILNKKSPNEASGLEKIEIIGSEYYYYFKENMGYFKLYMYEDYNSLDRNKIGEDLYNEFTEILGNLINIVTDALDLGVQDLSIKSDVNVGYLDKYFAYTIRTILNVAFSPEKVRNLEGAFDEESFYFQYLDLFLNALKNI
jgi:TetR/AcrR family transcriptional regulator